MRFTTHRARSAATLAPGAAPVSRSRRLAALIAATLALGFGGQLPGDASAATSGGLPADLRVGHTIKRIGVPGSALGERRLVDVHLWYPADPQGFSGEDKTVYRSGLYLRSLIRDEWDPLSWQVEAEVARETAINPTGQPFLVIVFSHGSVNEPIDYAHTLELIAGAGFVVAAPSHVNNTQDDVRIDFITTQAGAELLSCNDGRDGPCSRGNVPRSMEDRVRDIGAILDSLPGWFGDRVDVSRAGVLGHSRGTVTALAAAGGSNRWGFDRLQDDEGNPRLKGIMGLAIAVPAITFAVDLADVDVPALLVAGQSDMTSPPAVSEAAFEQMASTEKAFVSIAHATHRTFDSTYCDQMQAAAAVFDMDGSGVVEEHELANEGPLLDRHTVRGIVNAPPTGNSSGQARQYCAFDTFTRPTDIRPMVEALTGGIEITAQNVPSEGLETDEVKRAVTELAVAFFGTTLKRAGNDGFHFTRYLAPKWLEKHEPMVGRAEAVGRADAICPPGQDVVCDD